MEEHRATRRRWQKPLRSPEIEGIAITSLKMVASVPCRRATLKRFWPDREALLYATCFAFEPAQVVRLASAPLGWTRPAQSCCWHAQRTCVSIICGTWLPVLLAMHLTRILDSSTSWRNSRSSSLAHFSC